MAIKSKLFDAAQQAAGKSSLTINTVTAKAALQKATARAKKSYASPAPTTTDNGALAKKGTGSKVLDMFAKGGSYRNSSDADILKLIKPALKEEPALFGACLFYLRDVLEGQGERNFFRVSLRYLAETCPFIASELLPLVGQYGRWDDVFALKDTQLYLHALRFYSAQLMDDYQKLLVDPNASISLAGKWAPSERAGKASHRLWRDLVHMFDSSGQYRRIVTKLRARIRIVESAMCAKEWDSIDYSKVPSRASLLYRKAFKKNDGARYKDFIDSLKGKTKEEIRKSIKAATLYPYDLVSQCSLSQYGSKPDDETVDVLWEALPDYLQGRHKNSLAVVDTSGSMNSTVAGKVTALTVAISIGLYLAENATGSWAGQFITFSNKPTFQTVKGKTLAEKVRNMSNANWDGNTDLNLVFKIVLDLARKHGLSQEDMPETIFIISDMQFDEAMNSHWVKSRLTNYEKISADYEAAGYERPNLVFWTVKPGEASPVAYNEYGTALVSGFSANTFKNVFGDEYVSPPTAEQVMRDVLESERYQPVRDIFSLITFTN